MNDKISCQDLKSQPSLELLDSSNVLDYKIERLVRHHWKASDIACLLAKKQMIRFIFFSECPAERCSTQRRDWLTPSTMEPSVASSLPVHRWKTIQPPADRWKKIHTPLWWDETTNFKEGFIFCEQLAAHICSFWIGGPSEAWNEMIQYWVQVKMKRVKIVLTFFPTVRSWGPCRGRGLPIGWGLRCLVLVATGAILWVALEGMDEKDCPRCNPNFSHVTYLPSFL